MKLSVLIPSRGGRELKRTIEDILEHSEADTEIIVGFDGSMPEGFETFWSPGLKFHHEPEHVGQRAITNKLAYLSTSDYIMKVDAHCSFSQGFDRVMLSEMDDKTILAPLLMSLDGPTWTINGKKSTSRYCFDQNLVMQYDEENGNPETMCLQGSAWMVSRDNYWNWKLGDETLGSWGGQGPELGIKAWLNGGVCKTTRNAYYGHVFREKEEDFPYQRDKAAIKGTTDEIKKRFKNQKIAGLIKKFNYPADWTPEAVENLPL